MNVYHQPRLAQPVDDVDALVEGTDGDIRASLVVIAHLYREANDLQVAAAASLSRVRRSRQAVRQAADCLSRALVLSSPHRP